MVNEVKFLETELPKFTIKEVRRIGSEVFGFTGEFSPLSGERDQNFRFYEAGDRHFVLKFSNAEEDPEVVDFQIKALLHLEAVDPALPVPRIRRTLDGRAYTTVADKRGVQHIVRSLTFLGGRTYFGELRPESSWRSLGMLLGRLDKALRGFFHPSSRHELVWDVLRSPDLRPFTKHIADRTARLNVEKALDRMADEVMPRLKPLRHQVIHADIHADNILFDAADPVRVTGILDFGDMIFGPLVAELAIAADLDCVGYENIEACLAAMVSAYDEVLPLEEAELEMLYPLMLARYAANITILAARRALTPGVVPSDTHSDEPLWKFMDDLMSLGEDRIRRTVRRACAYPAGERLFSINAAIERRHRLLGKHSTIFYEDPVRVERSNGVWLYGPDGESYLDAYNNVPVAGHCHPSVVRAISRQTARLNTNTRYLYEVVLDYAERLTGTMAAPLSMCLFANSGSEANDIAWQIAKFHTGRSGGLVMDAAYHGITDATRPMSPSDSGRQPAPHIQTLENPDPYRGRFRRGEADLAEKYAADVHRAILDMNGSGHQIAAFMVDSAFVSSGMPEVPEGYLQAVSEKVRANGGLVIADEVQAGFGRSGTHLWGHAAHGIEPDVVTLGKPVANGYPMGVVVTRPDILEPFMAEYGLFSTFGGNPVACAAAIAVLDVIEEEDLITNARETGAYLLSEISKRAETFPIIGNVRGWGLLLGVELVRSAVTLEPAREETRRLLNSMRKNGVLVGREGAHGNVVKIRPPLVFRKQHAEIFLEAFDRSLSELVA